MQSRNYFLCGCGDQAAGRARVQPEERSMPARGPLAIAEPDRAVLRRWADAPAPGRRSQRAAIVLLAGQGLPNGEIARRLGVSRPAVITWRARYAEDGLPGLADRPRSGRPPQARVAAIVACTLRVAPRSRSATSCARWVAAELGVSVVTVGRPGGWRTSLSPPAAPWCSSLTRRSR
jgi:transposase